MFVAWMKSTAPGADPYLAVTILTVGIYLTVRGLDNIHHGMKDYDERTVTGEKPDRADLIARALCNTGNPTTSASRRSWSGRSLGSEASSRGSASSSQQIGIVL
jgi:hypothetical protein